MVASQKEEILRVFDFVGQQQANALDTLSSSIYIVAQEEIVGFWRKASILEES